MYAHRYGIDVIGGEVIRCELFGIISLFILNERSFRDEKIDGLMSLIYGRLIFN